MNKLDIKDLHRQARQIATESPGYRKTVLFHSAVSMAVLTAVMLLGLWTDSMMKQTGGLADIGLRSLLGTVDSVASMASSLLLPFWEVGILFTSLLIVRRQPVEFGMLNRGFRRFVPVAKYYILTALILMGAGILCSYGASFAAVFLAGPLGVTLPMEEMEEMLQNVDPSAITDPETLMEWIPLEQMMPMMVLVMVLFALIYGAVLLHLHYRFFAAPYFILDAPSPRGRAALMVSTRMTKGNKWNLFKLDISLWWYHLLLLAVSALSFVPAAAILAGVPLPISAAGANVIFYLIYGAAAVGLSWWAGAYVNTVYALAYEKLRQPQIPAPM